MIQVKEILKQLGERIQLDANCNPVIFYDIPYKKLVISMMIKGKSLRWQVEDADYNKDATALVNEIIELIPLELKEAVNG